ncbi:MAG: hypothetical protein H8E15_04635 [Planctomycetes bacterium]|nr:hypothetical protein [Planctomycetota bacterium]
MACSLFHGFSKFATWLIAGSALLQQDVWPPAPPLKEVVGEVAELPSSVQGQRLASGKWKLRFEFRPDGVEVDGFESVALAGTFNGWNRDAVPLTRQLNGNWRVNLELEEGEHLYKFVLDGIKWFTDPGNPTVVNDGHGGTNSVLRLGLRAQMSESDAEIGDGKIAVHGLQHEAGNSFFLQPAGDGKVLLRYRTLSHDVRSVHLHLRGQLPQLMTSAVEGPLLQTWEAVIAAPSRKTAYTFVLNDGETRGRHPQIFTMEKNAAEGFQTPDWAKDAIWYQIMPDRFHNGDASNNPEFTRPWTSDWYASSDFEGRDGQTFWQWYVFQRLYGGDIAGLQQKLGYLKDLGVNALYLNPVFESPSHHKYNATDFRHIDQHFGRKGDFDAAIAKENLLKPQTWTWTESDKVFLEFLREAKAAGFRVIIDGVFNHVGTAHPAFQDVQKNGKKSPYADWFDVTSWQPFEYNGWAGFGELPVFKKSADGFVSDGVKQHIFDITQRWMDPNGDGDPSDGIDGWRLDVPNEVPMPFWQEWRQLVKKVNPDAYISGEIWQRAENWLDGRHFDAVMNYPFASAAISWIGHRRQKFSVSEVDRQLAELRMAYPAEATYVLMNLLDSHDTDRLVSKMLNPDRDYDSENREQDTGSTYDNSKPGAIEYRKARLAALLQMTYVGAPMIYYGDEVGMWGPDDPSNRKPMLWPELQPYAIPQENFVMEDHLSFYRDVIALRNHHSALRRGSFQTLLTDDARDVWAFMREDDTQWVVVALNASMASADVDGEALLLDALAANGVSVAAIPDRNDEADGNPVGESGQNASGPTIQQVWGHGNRLGGLEGAVWVLNKN